MSLYKINTIYKETTLVHNYNLEINQDQFDIICKIINTHEKSTKSGKKINYVGKNSSGFKLVEKKSTLEPSGWELYEVVHYKGEDKVHFNLEFKYKKIGYLNQIFNIHVKGSIENTWKPKKCRYIFNLIDLTILKDHEEKVQIK